MYTLNSAAHMDVSHSVLSFEFLLAYYIYLLTTVSYAASVVTVTTVTSVRTVSIVNFVCILKHYFVISDYVQFITQLLAVSHSFLAVSHSFLAVSHSVFGSFHVVNGLIWLP